VILRDPHRHVFISAGWCLVICGMFFGMVFGSKYLGDHEIFPPALAAWLPVIVFGPTAFIMFDAIYT
jgi:lipopolysaccharide export system permease protein